jgi:hypothetical protein
MEEKDHLAAAFVDVVDEAVAVRPPMVFEGVFRGIDVERSLHAALFSSA